MHHESETRVEKSDFAVIEAESLTMRINRTLGTQAKLSWFPAINVPCNINVRASGQGVPKDRLCAALCVE